MFPKAELICEEERDYVLGKDIPPGALFVGDYGEGLTLFLKQVSFLESVIAHVTGREQGKKSYGRFADERKFYNYKLVTKVWVE